MLDTTSCLFEGKPFGRQGLRVARCALRVDGTPLQSISVIALR